jgi:hypothetical protein
MASYNCAFSAGVRDSSNFLTVFETSSAESLFAGFLLPHIQPKNPPLSELAADLSSSAFFFTSRSASLGQYHQHCYAQLLRPQML